MRSILSVALAACLMLAGVGRVRAADAADARAIVEKAVQALGGTAKLSKFPAASWKGKGKYYGFGEATEFTGEWFSNPPERMRVDMEMEFNGMKIKLSRAIDGDKGWNKVADMVEEMNANTVAEEKVSLYVSWVASLVPLLKDKAFQLAPLGDSRVNDKAAVGVKVSHKGRRDVSLYFDKQTGLLLKSEFRGKDVEAEGKEFTQETLYSNYKETDAGKRARTLNIKRDGQRHVELDILDVKPQEKLDANVFSKP